MGERMALQAVMLLLSKPNSFLEPSGKRQEAAASSAPLPSHSVPTFQVIFLGDNLEDMLCFL